MRLTQVVGSAPMSRTVETHRADAFQAWVNATGLINNDLREEAQGS